MANEGPGARLRIGFIGLGTMGAPMVRALAKSGYSACLYDIDQTLTKKLAAETGGEAAQSLQQIGKSSDVVITMLPNAQIVRDAIMGGVADGMKSGAIVVDMSSSYPLATRELGKGLAERGITLLDAPVSGGVRKAQSGTLAIMLGGEDEAAMKTATPVLESMGTVFRTGPLGSGHATKALNNYVSAAGLGGRLRGGDRRPVLRPRPRNHDRRDQRIDGPEQLDRKQAEALHSQRRIPQGRLCA